MEIYIFLEKYGQKIRQTFETLTKLRFSHLESLSLMCFCIENLSQITFLIKFLSYVAFLQKTLLFLTSLIENVIIHFLQKVYGGKHFYRKFIITDFSYRKIVVDDFSYRNLNADDFTLKKRTCDEFIKQFWMDFPNEKLILYEFSQRKSVFLFNFLQNSSQLKMFPTEIGSRTIVLIENFIIHVFSCRKVNP